MAIALNALVATGVLALVATGLYIVYGLMNVINMAHGEMVTIGAYTAIAATTFGAPFWLAVILAAIGVAAVGVLLERTVIRHLYGIGGLSTLLATWGVSIALQQVLRIWFGPSARFMPMPLEGAVRVFGTSYPVYRLVLVGLAVVIVGVLALLYRRSSIGLRTRAALESAERAEAMGIDTRRTYTVAFAVGSGLAGLSGALIAPLAAVTPLMGLDHVVQAFLVVMVGGVGGVISPLAGSTLVAGTVSIATNALGATLAQILVLFAVVVAVFVRPNGLFGTAAR